MAHDAAAARIMAEQREYAARHDLPALFHALLTGLVVHAPREPFAWLAGEAERLRAAAAAGGPRAEAQPVGDTAVWAPTTEQIAAGAPPMTLSHPTDAFAAPLAPRVPTPRVLQPPFEAQSEADAAAYLARHGVEGDLEALLAAALWARPPDVLAFLGAEAGRLAAARRGGSGSAGAGAANPLPHAAAPLFTPADLRAMFRLYDPAGSGAVTHAQLASAAGALGLPPQPQPQPVAAAAGGPDARVDEDAFVGALEAGLRAREARHQQPAAA